MPNPESSNKHEPKKFRKLSDEQALSVADGYALYGHRPDELDPEVGSRMYEAAYRAIKSGSSEMARWQEVLERYAMMELGRSLGYYFCYPDDESMPKRAKRETHRRAAVRQELEASILDFNSNHLGSKKLFKSWILYEHIDSPLLLEPALFSHLAFGIDPKRTHREGNRDTRPSPLNGETHELMGRYRQFLIASTLTALQPNPAAANS